jgi:hypothetical protein
LHNYTFVLVSEEKKKRAVITYLHAHLKHLGMDERDGASAAGGVALVWRTGTNMALNFSAIYRHFNLSFSYSPQFLNTDLFNDGHISKSSFYNRNELSNRAMTLSQRF